MSRLSLLLAAFPLAAADHTSPSLPHSGPNPLKVAILLERLGKAYDIVPLDFSDDAKNGVKGAEFLKLNPNGRVPALVDHTNGDFTVWESGAILYYLARKYDSTYLGKTPEEEAVTMQWLTHQLSGLGVSGVAWRVGRDAWPQPAARGSMAP